MSANDYSPLSPEECIMSGIVKFLKFGILPYLVAGLFVSIFTSNIGLNTFKSPKAFERSITAILVWPVPLGAPLCHKAVGDNGINCGGFHLPSTPFKIVKTPKA
jgi:hypothetical protein